MRTKKVKQNVSLLFFSLLIFSIGMLFTTPPPANAQTVEELQNKIMQLEKKLSAANAELQKIKKTPAVETEKKSNKIQFGPLKIGGAIRANYVIGDYDTNSAGPSRGGHGGNVEFDTFRINLDYAKEQWIGKLEYRFQDGYNFLHTGWVGYNFEDKSQIQVGVNRVPFGPGAYGISQSWFFDQHYYVRNNFV